MAKAATKKKWTVMVYLAGDNDLDSAGVTDLGEMKKVGSNAAINLVAEFDRAGKKLKTNRYYLRKGTPLRDDVVQSLGETNTGDPAVLDGFVRWAAASYPAERYMLVLWNHGAGWDDTNVYRTARDAMGMRILRRRAVAAAPKGKTEGEVPLHRLRAIGGRGFRRALFRTPVEQAIRKRAIAFDDSAKDFLDNLEVKKVLSGARRALGQKLDILGMDACLMSMAEVTYQVRDSVGVTVGSQEVEPTDGWPYDTILAALARKPGMGARDLAAVIVNKYLASYPSSEAVTQSACDLSHAETLVKAVDALGKALKAALPADSERLAIIQARAQAQSFDTPDYVDLVDLAQLIQAGAARPEVDAACKSVIDAVTKGGFVIAAGFKGKTMDNSNGVSIYFPVRRLSPLYDKLDFARRSAWEEFLEAYLASVSRRPGR